MRDGAPLYAPSIAADKVSGLHLAYAVLAALLYRERTGKAPGYVEVPMFELMAAFSLCEHLGAATFEEDGKVGYVRVLSPGRRPYKTKDGWVGVLPYTERNWTKILTEIGRADVAELAWFKNATERSRRVDELYDILAEACRRAPRPSGSPSSSASTSRIPAGAPAAGPARATRTSPMSVSSTPIRRRHAGHAHAAPGRQRGGGGDGARPATAAPLAPTPRPCCARPAAARRRLPRPCRPPNAADARGGPC